ncbi:MAG: hypothetical protein ICV78_25250 [Tolypothrix sp. Co-bin9]|nr:hypothetical protein [Tolypothrix sp. Co-bin9]
MSSLSVTLWSALVVIAGINFGTMNCAIAPSSRTHCLWAIATLGFTKAF